MTVRVTIWLIGLSASASLAFVLGANPDSREFVVPLVLVLIAIAALLAELAAFTIASRGNPRGRLLETARQADGLVDLVNLVGVESEPCSARTKIRRFVKLMGQPGAPGQPRATDRPFLGKVVLVSVFVGEDGVPWSDDEIAAGHEALERAGVWVEREAIRHQAPLNLSLAEVYFQVEDDVDDPVEVSFSPEGDDFGPMEANASTKAVVMASRAASRLGFRDIADWMGQIDQRIDADATAWLFLARRAGRSMAIASDLSGIPGVAFAVCYAQEASFPEPLNGRGRVDPATIAHELLHLFGASDKYGVALSYYPRGAVSSREIMRLNHDSLSRMRIDPLTAVEIGWLNSIDCKSVEKKSRRHS